MLVKLLFGPGVMDKILNPVSVYFIAGPPDIVIPINDVHTGFG